MPPGGLSIRWPDPPLEQERRLHGPKMRAVAAFARANAFDRITLDSPTPRLGIARERQGLSRPAAGARRPRHRRRRCTTAGPAHLQGRAGLAAGGSGRAPFRRRACRTFSSSRKSAASSRINSSASSTTWRRRVAPRSSASATNRARRLLPSEGELDANHGRRRADRRDCAGSGIMRRRWSNGWRGSNCSSALAPPRAVKTQRTPYFCSGCPHNTSTKVPEGSRAMAGIGCHGMAMSVPSRRTATITHMGGRRRQLDRSGAVHERAARLPEHGRRHLHPFRVAGAARSSGGRRQHHLQDPLQRRGSDDRRAAGRGRAHGRADRPSSRGGGRAKSRDRLRRA